MRSGIARFAMRRRATAVGALILVFVMGGTALAVGPGATFKLGVVNSISGYVTTLTGSNNGAMLAIKNTNTNTGARGLNITVAAGRAPIVVNGTAGKATGLNADKVDGKNASAFLPVGGKALDAFHADAADKVDNYDANGLVRTGRGANSITVPADYTTEVTVAQVTITAPAAGFVLVNGNMTTYAASSTGCPCEVWMNLRDMTSGGAATWFMPTHIDAPYYDTASQSWVFQVGAGTRTYAVRGVRVVGATSTSLYVYGNITALYVPFGSTGAGTLGAAGTSNASQPRPSR